MEFVRGVHSTFDEEYTVLGCLGVVFIIQEGELAELWATRCYIHVSDRSLEAGAP